MGIARLYFERVDVHRVDAPNTPCERSRELLADVVILSVHGEGAVPHANYWMDCRADSYEALAATLTEALGVVRSALAGEMPSWFADNYHDSEGNPDLERLWSHVRAAARHSFSEDPILVYQLRNEFGGYCSHATAIDAVWNYTTRNPWRDGGCVPKAPSGLAAIVAENDTITVSWERPDDDGGSTITGYKVQWKSGAEDYGPSRQRTVTDLADLSYTIDDLTEGVDYTIRVLAYNRNGDGATSDEVMQAAVSTDASLSGLTLDTAEIRPAFSSGRTSYTASAGYTVSELTVKPTASEGAATVEFLDDNGNTLTDADSAEGFQMSLSVGTSVVAVTVTAPDGVATETYTVTVTRADDDLSLSPPASDPAPAAYSAAVYTIDFQGGWTTAATPRGRPSGAHFSRLIGAVHNVGATFLERGETASDGVESMAETGGTSTLTNEINLQVNADPPAALAVLRGTTDNIGPTATRTLSDVRVTTEHPRVTLTTMIAPSPDWFVGVSGLVLYDAQDGWLQTHTVDLYPWAAGTENGTRFSLSNTAAEPRGVITSISGAGKFSAEPIATLTFARQSVSPSFPSTESGARSVPENTAPGQDIGAAVAATDPDNDTLTYALGGPDAAAFDIVPSSGQLQTKVALDFESRDSYSVKVTASDPSGLAGEIDVTITVTNVDEPATVWLSPALLRVADVIRARISDPDADPGYLDWYWERSTDKTDWTPFRVDGHEYTPGPHDQGMYLRVRVKYRDGYATGYRRPQRSCRTA